MALKPEASLMVGLASATVAYGVFSAALPTAADVRSLPAGQKDVSSTERTAAWIAAASVAGIALMARDMTVFIIGGTAVIGLSWWYKHSNMVMPELGLAVPKMAAESQQVSEQGMAEGEMYDYGQSEVA